MIASVAVLFGFAEFVISSLVLVPMSAGPRKNLADPAGASEGLQIGQSRNGSPTPAPERLSGALRPSPEPSAPRPFPALTPQPSTEAS